MKLTSLLLVSLSCILIMQPDVNAQINPLKKFKNKTNEQINKGIDKSFDKAFNKKKKEKEVKDEVKNDQNAQPTPNQETKTTTSDSKDQVTNTTKPELKWSKYDFVPGDKIIFEDNLIGEENGEFPSRWDLITGNVEVAQLGDENVIMFRAGSPGIIPYLKDPKKDYLPDIFTIEFDLYCGDGTFEVILYDRKNQKSGSSSGYTSIKIQHNQMGWTNNYSEIPDQSLPKRRWVHIAIAYTHGKLKAYHDETRLINVPRIDFEPKGLTLYTYIFGTLHEGHYYVKNVRIAEGGVKYYDRILKDGKIIANGIRFDVGKASLKPESMGIINEINELMTKYPELNFSVEGHTDNTGDDASNQKLSADRAESVMNKLIDLGISKDRLSSKGLGESKPINDNNTPEGRANNRRVEFVKSN